MSELLIGKKIEIVDSTNKQLMKINGEIVDETKFTFLIKVINQKTSTLKRVVKKNIKFIVDGKIIDGKKIMQKSYERLKNGKRN